MIDEKYLKPIPNYIAKRIRNIDKRNEYCGNVRFYAYLSKMKGELVKITVACKNYKYQWFCKQVAVHGVHSQDCIVCDMEYFQLGGYGVGWYNEGLSDSKKSYEDGKWYPANDKYYDPVAEVVNKKYALKFDIFKYSALDKYPYWDVLKYLRTYEKYPQAEYFIKIGLQHHATNKTLLKKAGKDKAFRKWLIRNARLMRNEYGKYPYFSGQVILSSYKKNMTLIDGQIMDRAEKEILHDYNYTNTISQVIPKKKIVEFVDYIQKQNTNTSSYADYVKACNYIGLDMTLPKNLYPHDFQRWHDIRIDEYRTAKALKDAEERKELYAKFADVAEKYLPLQRNKEDAFIMVIARSPQDLIHEGEALSHCVGRMNYDQKFAREETLIFFVRDKECPDVPFVTVEYSLKNKKVLQCYGEHDRKPNDSVLEFVNKKWLPFANRQLKKIQAAA